MRIMPSFNSSFGSGNYESFSLSRQMSDRLRLEVLVGSRTLPQP